MEALLNSLIPFLVLLTALVFVHELGHYVVARRCGVRVLTFSIGFGPELFGWNDKSGTRWRISAIPLGGYVKMFGDADASSSRGSDNDGMTDEEKAVSFHAKPLGSRSAIVAAGPLANFAFAAVLLAILYAFVGTPVASNDANVGAVSPDSAAEAAGLAEGDRIRAIDGRTLTGFEDLRTIVAASPDTVLSFRIERDGRLLDLDVTPAPVTLADGTTIGRVGIAPRFDYETRGIVDSVIGGAEGTWRLTVQTVLFLGRIITGDESSDNIGGPIGIAMLSGEMAKRGFGDYLFFAALLSVNLGLINLLPVPVLDGGHLAFYAVEAVRGRPLGEKAQEYGFRLGLVLILLLFLFATKNDIGRLAQLF
ncbi:MAG: RIP metalloprotease RseP [Rhodospirillales bacterium]